MRRLVEAIVLAVVQHADDGREPHAGVDAPADGVLPRKEVCGERFVDQCHAKRAGTVTVVDIAALHDANAHRCRVVAADLGPFGGHVLVHCRRIAFDLHLDDAASPEAQRNHARDAGILDARQRTDARENLRHHRRSRTVVDARRAQVRVDEQYVLRIRETDVDG